uniref:RNA binding S1 domain-containing protein n=1 Tax=uncultured marine thaumarchaeote KM3_154_A05 TaxID=1456020 RepID=A0A075GJR6_9ARCH|nr:RNA binding S1 domain-containing protein [uncultured marine thaumarchaeote KM3_154_A05]
MTTEVHELPEEGEIVIATIAKIGDHGAYATLDEYNNVQGFLHVSEIAHGWVRNISKFVKEGEKKVLLVKKIREGRAEIDLSLKQISREQQKRKLLDVKRFEKGKTLLKIYKRKQNYQIVMLKN